MEVFRSLAWAMSHQGERLDEEGRWVAANCAGLAVLYRAGVLDGYEVTGPATVARRLAALGVDVASPRRSCMLDPERHVFTVAGAASVHPSTMARDGRTLVPRSGRALMSRDSRRGALCDQWSWE